MGVSRKWRKRKRKQKARACLHVVDVICLKTKNGADLRVNNRRVRRPECSKKKEEQLMQL